LETCAGIENLPLNLLEDQTMNRDNQLRLGYYLR